MRSACVILDKYSFHVIYKHAGSEKPWQEIGEQLQAMQTPHAHPIKDHHVTTFFIAFFTLKMGFNNWRSLLTESNSDWRLYNDANKHFRRRLFFFLTKYATSEGRFTIFFFNQEINENPSWQLCCHKAFIGSSLEDETTSRSQSVKDARSFSS